MNKFVAGLKGLLNFKLDFTQRNIHPHMKDIYCLIIIFSVAGTFLFYQIPGEIGDDGVTHGIIAMSINNARESNSSVSALFEDLVSVSNEKMTPVHALQRMTLGNPLWHLLLSISFSIFGASVFSTLALSSFIGLLTIISVYFLGKEMSNRLTGLLAALLLSSSLFFILHTRSGSGFIALVPLTVVSSIYFFYLAHKRMNRRLLWISGIAISICIFNGYTPVFLLPPILIVFVIWKVNFRSLIKSVFSRRSVGEKNDHNLFSITEYLLTGGLSFGIFLLITIVFSIYILEDPLATFSHILGERSQQTSLLTYDRYGFDRSIVLNANIRRFLGDMFIAVKNTDSLQGAHTQHYLPGRPLIAPLASVFFIIGLILSVKRRSVSDKLCLIWWFATFISFSIHSGFIGRAAIVGAPVIYIIAAKAMVDLTRFFKGVNHLHISLKR